MGYQPSPDYWTVQIKQGKKTTYVCKPCNDHLERLAHRAREHEQTQKHQEKLKVWQDRQRANHPGPSQPSQQLPSSVEDTVLDDAVRALLVSCSSDPSTTPYPPSHPALPPYTNPRQRSPSPVTGIDWNLLEALGDTQFEHAPLDQALSDAAQASLNILNGAILSDDEWIERASACGSDAEDDSDQDAAPSAPADKRARNFEPDAKTQREWYPWLDRITCILDVFMHLPRSVFSERQLDLILFVLRNVNVNDVPSVRSQKAHNKLLQTAYGIETVPYVEAMGDRYYVNNLSQILAQEMANPRVRHHISFYPEDSRPFLGEARQGAKWLHEMPHVDVEAKVFESKELYNMGNVVGNPSREHQLTSEAKRKASHVRNQFRTDLKKSVVGPTACSLDDFCVRCATKYRAGISAAADQKYIIRNALLRRFAYENKEYLDLKERVSISSSSDDEGDAAGEVDEEPVEDTGSGTTAGGKRKRNAKMVKTDYWALSDEWFREEIKTRGDVLTDPRWRSYIDETIRRDRAKFPGKSASLGAAFMATADPVAPVSVVPVNSSPGSAHAEHDNGADATQALFASAGIY